jgi:hypothetical protein
MLVSVLAYFLFFIVLDRCSIDVCQPVESSHRQVVFILLEFLSCFIFIFRDEMLHNLILRLSIGLLLVLIMKCDLDSTTFIE